ncbi:acyl carrier protein [Streptomyces sp. Tu 3180]|uniref:acyl carrier protein n=1 Tax=Streptomyces sp. Tu 3180 TaxID=2682611 RepID=UPI00135934B8|nr:acyl carrier protein [Streptomyces sp. Tu 3180]KAF3463512.1 acyl carrier protein [Streptomyces sp. Tu 3180]
MDTRFVETLTPFLPFLHGETITEDTPLRTYGLDSMQAIELMFALEDGLGVSLPDEALVEETFATAGNLWRAVQAARDTGAVTAESV